MSFLADRGKVGHASIKVSTYLFAPRRAGRMGFLGFFGWRRRRRKKEGGEGGGISFRSPFRGDFEASR